MRRHHRVVMGMRRDPHAGKTPGLGCGCALCKEPMPLVAQLNPIQGQMARDRFESERAAWNAEGGMPAPENRARAPGRDTRTL